MCNPKPCTSSQYTTTALNIFSILNIIPTWTAHAYRWPQDILQVLYLLLGHAKHQDGYVMKKKWSPLYTSKQWKASTDEIKYELAPDNDYWHIKKICSMLGVKITNEGTWKWRTETRLTVLYWLRTVAFISCVTKSTDSMEDYIVRFALVRGNEYVCILKK